MEEGKSPFEEIQPKKFLSLNYAEVIGVLGIFLAGNVISSVVYFGLSYILSYDDFNNFGTPIIWVVPFLVTLVGVYLIFLKPKEANFNFGFRLSSLLIYPVMFLMFFGAILLNEPIAEAIPKSGLWGVLDALYKMMEIMEKTLLNYPYSTAFMVVILAPIFEEILFRGIILKGMLNNKVNPSTAIIISALIFGLVHANPWQFVGATLLGCLLGYVYYKTQSIINVMLLHFLNNGIGVLVFFYFKKMNVAEALDLSIYGSIFFGAILLSVFGFLFYKLTKNYTWKFS